MYMIPKSLVRLVIGWGSESVPLIKNKHGKVLHTLGTSNCPDEMSKVLKTYKVGPKNQLSNEKNLGWLGYIGDYTTQFYWDYSKQL